MIHLYHRNTRRYGGYIVHFGVALVVIGILGTPFNKEVEKEMGFGDKLTIVPTPWSASPSRKTTIQLRQRVGDHQRIPRRQADHDYVPERRFYKASGQPQTLPRIYPSFREDFFLVSDLYLVYEARTKPLDAPSSKPTSIRWYRGFGSA